MWVSPKTIFQRKLFPWSSLHLLDSLSSSLPPPPWLSLPSLSLSSPLQSASTCLTLGLASVTFSSPCLQSHQALLFWPPPCSCLMHRSLLLLSFFISSQSLPSPCLLLMCHWSLRITWREAEAPNAGRRYIRAWHGSTRIAIKILSKHFKNVGFRQPKAIVGVLYCCFVHDLEVLHQHTRHYVVHFKDSTNV